MNRHPDDETLLAWCGDHRADGSRGAGSAGLRDLEKHLAGGCERCRSRVHEFEAVLELLRGPALDETPAAWIQEALSRIPSPSRSRQAAPRTGVLQRIVDEIAMSLALDTRIGASLAGIRGAVATRQILFEAEADPAIADLHVQIETAPRDRFDLRGQLVSAGEPPDRPASAMIEIQAPGRAPAERACRLSAGGDFRFRGLPRARVRLRITSGARVFLAGPFDLD